MTSALHTDPQIMHGTPCFTGTRVPAKALFDLLAHGRSIDYFLEQFPSVSRQQVLDVLKLASAGIVGQKTAA